MCIAISPKPSGMTIWALQRGISGEIFMGNSFSTMTKLNAPYPRQRTMNTEIILAKKFFVSIFFSVLNNGFEVKDSNLFFLDAITAPKNPIHSVRCWTKTEEATTPVLQKMRVITSTEGNKTNREKIKRVKYFSIRLTYGKIFSR